MACFRPSHAWQSQAGGGLVWKPRAGYVFVSVPCGNCVGCLQDRANTWALRILHEARTHTTNCFVTLTYDEDHVPGDFGLRYSDVRAFWKRLRRELGPFRYYIAGEYGPKYYRPHWHAILFGLAFTDRRAGQQDSATESPTLTRLWGNGHASVGELNPRTAMYVAKYAIKKQRGKVEDLARYQRVSLETGETFTVPKEFARMSLRPGIGARWYERYFHTDVLPHDGLKDRGQPRSIPRFYKERLKKESPERHQQLMETLRSYSRANEQDSTPQRLATREVVATAASKQKRRTLE